MKTADEILRDWIRSYYYGEVSEETIKADADACIKFMKENGWEFDSRTHSVAMGD